MFTKRRTDDSYTGLLFRILMCDADHFVQGIVYGRPNCCSNLYDLGLIGLLELCVVYNR